VASCVMNQGQDYSMLTYDTM